MEKKKWKKKNAINCGNDNVDSGELSAQCAHTVHTSCTL